MARALPADVTDAAAEVPPPAPPVESTAKRSQQKVHKDYIINRQGKDFVLYVGLLDLAHRTGLAHIHTEIVQLPTKDNGSVAVCTAIATFEEDGKIRTFTGIGDADPSNVNAMMKSCLLRMAETRAKARALRDATNITMVAYEELPEETEEQQRSRQRPEYRSDPSRGPARQAPARPQQSNGAATPNQINAIQRLAQSKGYEPYDDATVSSWTNTIAAQLIKDIQTWPPAEQEAA